MERIVLAYSGALDTSVAGPGRGMTNLDLEKE